MNTMYIQTHIKILFDNENYCKSYFDLRIFSVYGLGPVYHKKNVHIYIQNTLNMCYTNVLYTWFDTFKEHTRIKEFLKRVLCSTYVEWNTFLYVYNHVKLLKYMLTYVLHVVFNT